MRKYETDRKYPSQYGSHNKAKSWVLTGDLASWCKERQKACFDSLTP